MAAPNIRRLMPPTTVKRRTLLKQNKNTQCRIMRKYAVSSAIVGALRLFRRRNWMTPHDPAFCGVRQL
eukprot:15441695-Alexandrium_andersonii.AAC.1